MSEHAMRLTVPVSERDHVVGAASAKLELVEYGDYECPHCASAYGVLKDVRAALGDELRFVYRNFPLTSVHVHAQRAAETAEWAALHGRFWEMHDYLFEHHNDLTDRGLLAAAKALKLDGKSLQQTWENHAMIARIKEDFLAGIQSGVTGTPKLFINGARYEGAVTVADLTAALHAARG